jgi:hypothetical protein
VINSSSTLDQTENNMARFWTVASALVVLASVLAFVSIGYIRSSRLPPSHLLNHPVILDENALTSQEADDLMALMQRLGEFRTHAADLSYYKTTHEHVGEAQPLSPQGACTHPFLIPSSDRSACVLPGRLDVARAYALAGGYEGLKETLPLLLSRVQSFGRYHFNISEHAEVESLFNKPQFQVRESNCSVFLNHLFDNSHKFVSLIKYSYAVSGACCLSASSTAVGPVPIQLHRQLARSDCGLAHRRAVLFRR